MEPLGWSGVQSRPEWRVSLDRGMRAEYTGLAMGSTPTLTADQVPVRKIHTYLHRQVHQKKFAKVQKGGLQNFRAIRNILVKV